MRKKIFSLALSTMLFALCFSAEAQEPRKIPRIGFLSASSRSTSGPLYAAFLEGLQQIGFVEGKNIIIDSRWADGKAERLPELAAELIRLKVDIIVVGPVQPALAAKKATTTIPIVITTVADPVEFGLVSSLARPGGNITGLTSAPGIELNGKRLEVLKEVFPNVSRVAVLWNPDNPGSVVNKKANETPARSLGIKLQSVEMRQPSDLETAFTSMKKAGAEVLVTINSPLVSSQVQRIVNLAAKNRLPGIHAESRWTEAGGLMSYGPNYFDLCRRAATYVDKILKGAKPGDLPIEQPRKFEFIINLKTAKQIGLTIPQSVLFRADRVIK